MVTDYSAPIHTTIRLRLEKTFQGKNTTFEDTVAVTMPAKGPRHNGNPELQALQFRGFF